MNYLGTGSACAARLIPASSLTSAMRRRPASSTLVMAPMSPPSFSPPIPHFMPDATVDLEPISSSA